jgi:hypothetical protein
MNSGFDKERINDDMWGDKDFVKEMTKRTEELESGEVKGYSWDEVRA